MLDFLMIGTKLTRSGVEIFPKFIVGESKDLLTRGHDFYAIWDQEQEKWTKNRADVCRLVDNELNIYTEKYKQAHPAEHIYTKYMRDGDSGAIDKWNHYVTKQLWDNFVQLDDKIIFAGQSTCREDFSTFSLPYALKKAPTPAWDELVSTLYTKEERRKIEWAIGSVVCGDSKWRQKFCVFVGDAGTGKSTILTIIRWLFGDYCATIDAKAIGSNNAAFALDSLTGNPLVAIQDDTDLSKIEDNARLNSLISHEPMRVNEKFKATYEASFHCMLFLGSNKEVQITDAKSGIIRRLIDIEPSGKTLNFAQYNACKERIKFELGGIAYHCLQVYQSDPDIYNSYVPTRMMRNTNVVYSFLEEKMNELYIIENDGISLNSAWMAYNDYCDKSNIMFKLNKQKFKIEIKGYFKKFYLETRIADGTHVWNWYSGLRYEKFGMPYPKEEEPDEEILEELDTWIFLKNQPSILDNEFANCPAQYANSFEAPRKDWAYVQTRLKDLDTKQLHYTKQPSENYIFIDFDLKNANGEKDTEANIKAASSFPPTYAELSKGGGLHLHYIYDGNVDDLSALFAPGIEIKVLKGGSSLRRKLSLCNDLPIASINSGLPLKPKEANAVFNSNEKWNEQGLRTFIQRALLKEYPPCSTVCNIDYIDKKLNELYNSGVAYDVSDMYEAIYKFAARSHNNKKYCTDKVSKMKLVSECETPSTEYVSDYDKLVVFDVEVFPNLFVVVWKPIGEPCIVWVNPTAVQIETLCKYKLIGFNNRNYDNHILFARMLGYDNLHLYYLSRDLIKGLPVKFRPAYNLSYTDIYDFASAMHKFSLKKWEVKLGELHKELNMPWDADVPEDKWNEVTEYCTVDVEMTEKLWFHLKGDWTARQILADLAGGSVNDTTNQLTAKIIFDGKPKTETDTELVYTDLTTIFPGYKFENGVSTYRGIEVGEGGFVYSEPGTYHNVALLDIASMHPTSIEQLNLFGCYTENYSALKKGRILIKHKNWDELATLLNGKLKPYVDKARESGDMSILKDLSNALKTALNSAYGLTSAKFENQLRHKDNVDNIVAKRGSLFMVNLLNEVQARGFTVAHIKTDSIKIPDATPEIIQFVTDYGKQYGYDFEHEATYDRICLVNDAVYIAKYADGEHEFELPTGEKVKTSWTATGTQFQVPYVFKRLFSGHDIKFEDLIETKSVKSSLYLDMNEGLPDVSGYEKDYIKQNRLLKKAIADNDQEAADAIKNAMDELSKVIATGHDYNFVGRVGAFCPILPNRGGGLLMRQQDDKFVFATGTKGFRWLEAIDVKGVREMDIDISYFEDLAQSAKEAINVYGSFDEFIGRDLIAPYDVPDEPWAV